METTSNELFVQVVINSISMGFPEFEMHYSEVSMVCGGHLYLTESSPNLEMTSPNYPSPPSHDIECEWIITSPSGTRMRMDFDEEFHMTPECDGDGEVEYLEINDGGTEMSPPLHRFCGHDQPSSVMSTGNAIYARYVTAVANPQAGFKARVRIAACGGTISASNAVIKSPNYPNNYGNSQECEWYLKMPGHYHIDLTLTDLSTPRPSSGQNCNATDYLEVRNNDENGEVLEIYCGTITNTTNVLIRVSGSSAYVKFKTNSAQTDKGFSLYMKANYNDGCGFFSEIPNGIITSPNYPNPLPATRDCTWRLSAPEGRRVKLQFTSFKLPRDVTTGICLSYIQVFNATYWRSPSFNDHEKICGNTLPAPIESSSAQLIVHFHTEGLGPTQGFSSEYTTEEEGMCGGVLQLPSGVIEIPNFTVQNDSYVNCKWRTNDVETVNQTLVLTFDVLEIPALMANYCREAVMYFTGRMFLGRVCGNYSREMVITSPYLGLSVRLVASLGKPIRMHGTYNISNCGGIINANHGEIVTPGYPDAYPPNTICHWLITAPPGETVTLTIEDLRMEDNCEKDYLLVRNGHYMYSPVVGRFCGTHVPVPITSSGHELTVIFHTDAYGAAPGVKMHTNEVQRGCGGLIHMLQGNISSPNYPSRYDNNVECRWVIEFVHGYYVKLDFIGRFDIEQDSSCSKDYIMVEEYNDDGTWTEALKKCGPANPEPYLSKTNKVRITFRSNRDINGDGFNIAYSTACGGNFSQPSGEIFSPNYPDMYATNLNCTYTIGQPFQYVSLSFDPYFSVEGNSDCIFDNLTLYHGNVSNSTMQGPYCGTEAPASRTLRGPATLVFATDHSFNAHGFKAHYEITNCGSILTQPSGVISSPKTTVEYMNEVECTWQILAPSNRVIALKFSHFNLELSYRCWEDYLEIRDGLDTGPLIGKMCGNSTTVVKSTGNVLTLKFHMDAPRIEKGFSAFYHTTYGINQGCGGVLNMSSGEIQSLDVDSDGFYEPNLDCSWLVQGDLDQVLQVTFDRFDVEQSSNNTCIYDFVELREDIEPDSSIIGRYCGSTPPTTLITAGSRMYVIFHSDGKNNKAGFKLRFQSVASPCGPSALLLSSEPQTLNSPNYPNNYPMNLRCRWTISETENRTGRYMMKTVQLTINQLDVPCGGDYVEVQKSKRWLGSYQRRRYPGMTGSSGSPVRLCGATPVHDIIAFSGMSVTFHSDSVNNAARGFSLTYKESGCNRNYTADSDVITNSAFPGRYNSGRKCTIIILAPQGKTIAAYFHRLELYDPDRNCLHNNMKVYDGANNTAALLGTYCGFEPPPPIFSTENALYIEVNIPRTTGLYYINYMTTDQGRGCGGSLYAEEGMITSPMYPQTYNRNSECLWHITVPGYHTVQLSFKSLHLNSTNGCDSNYVELYDGSTDQIADRVVRYCGTDTPGVHNSKSNEVTIKFKSSTSNDGPGFALTFTTNSFMPDSSSSVIQRHNTEEVTNPSEKIIYLT